MRRLLVISYFYPPCAKAGVQRVLRLARHLPSFGWEPVFVAPKNGSCDRPDPALLRDVRGCRVYWTKECTPFRGRSLAARAGARLARAVVLPDPHLSFGVRAAETAERAARETLPDAVFVTSSEPWSTFIAGYHLSKRTGLPLFLDYRDPWTDGPGATLTGIRAALIKPLEGRIVRRAAGLFATTRAIAQTVTDAHPEAGLNNVAPFHYSFEPQQFEGFVRCPPADRLRLVYLGGVSGIRGRWAFARALSAFAASHTRPVELEVYGSLFRPEDQPRLKELGLEGVVKTRGFVPVETALAALGRCHVGLLPFPENSRTAVALPGKLFDYLGARLPTLYIGVEGELSALLRKTGLGLSVGKSVEKMEAGLREIAALVESGGFSLDEEARMEYSGRRTVEGFVRTLQGWLAA